MQIFGFNITRTKALPRTLQSVDSRGGWWPRIHEPFAGAWQRNMSIDVQDVLTHSTVWACVTLIASDISKLWLRLVEKDEHGIWTEVTNESPFKPVLRKPNRYQTRIKLIECWILSKLIRGNTYALKQRDQRGIVSALYILDPGRVQPMVAPDGSVFYQLNTDHLSGIQESTITVPASEIIHDLMVPLYHPLVGVSPIHACGLAAMQGLKIQNNSEQFFANYSQPGGVLTAPGFISDETAIRLKDHWESQFTGANAGRVAVLGDGLHYEPMTTTPHDAQLIEQLKWTGENVCSAFHVPPWKVGLAPMPPYGNVQAANIEYYGQALQQLIECLEASLDEGLELPRAPRELGVELDLDALLRMDSAMQMDIATKGVLGAIYTPNEGRELFSKKPVQGGNDCFLQQQNYSLSALQKRDASADPFGTATPSTSAPEPTEPELTEDEEQAETKAVLQEMLAA